MHVFQLHVRADFFSVVQYKIQICTYLLKHVIYRTSGSKETPNCYLSDILQRDLLSDVDYVADRTSWLFAWDNYNPECMALATGEYRESGNGIGGRQENSRGSGRGLGT